MSKKIALVLFLLTIIFLILFSCTVPATSTNLEDDSNTQSYDEELSNGMFKSTSIGDISSNKGSPYITVTESSTGRCHVKINLRPDGYRHYARVNFSIYPDGSGSGYQVNIGNSVSNDGWGGDSSDQQNDSELMIYNNSLYLYANDKGNTERLLYKPGWWDNRPIYFNIKNNYLKYYRYYESYQEITNSNIFCLDGQSDSEGPVDYIIYASFNRVIKNENRIGSGAGKIIINFYDTIYKTLVVNESYKLLDDHYGPIIVNNDNVNLNLNGKTVYGKNTDTGITINNKENVSVSFGNVRNFSTGVLMSGNGSGNSLIYVNSYDNMQEGFRLEDLDGSGSWNSGRLISCEAESNNDEGFKIIDSKNFYFYSCYSNSNVSEGFRIEGSSNDNLSFQDCSSYENQRDGFDFDHTTNSEILRTYAQNNGLNGIEFDYSDNITIDRCRMEDNGQHGLSVSNNSSEITVTESYSHYNGENGFNFNDGVTEVSMSDSKAWYNGINGFRIQFTTNSTFDSCEASINNEDGFNFDDGANSNTLSNSLSKKNKEDGIDLDNGASYNTISTNTSQENLRDGFHLRDNSNYNRIEYNTSTNNVDDPYDESGCSGNVKIGNSWQ